MGGSFCVWRRSPDAIVSVGSCRAQGALATPVVISANLRELRVEVALGTGDGTGQPGLRGGV